MASIAGAAAQPTPSPVIFESRYTARFNENIRALSRFLLYRAAGVITSFPTVEGSPHREKNLAEKALLRPLGSHPDTAIGEARGEHRKCFDQSQIK
jgi:hypothetical protein